MKRGKEDEKKNVVERKPVVRTVHIRFLAGQIQEVWPLFFGLDRWHENLIDLSNLSFLTDTKSNCTYVLSVVGSSWHENWEKGTCIYCTSMQYLHMYLHSNSFLHSLVESKLWM